MVIPAYNTADYIAASLESLIAQSFSDWEAVVVDDGSPDNVGEIAKRYAKSDNRIRVLQKSNMGVSTARNIGIAELRHAKYLAFLDSDDIWVADALKILTSALDAQPDALAVHALATFITRDGLPNNSLPPAFRDRLSVSLSGRLTTAAVEAPTDFAMLSIACCILTGTVMMRQKVIKGVGVFDPTMRISEDWHLWLRIAASKPIVFVDEVVLGVRQRPDSATRNSKLMRNGEPLLRRKIAADPNMTGEHLDAFQLGHRFSCQQRLVWAARSLKDGDWRKAVRQAAQCLRCWFGYLRLLPRYRAAAATAE